MNLGNLYYEQYLDHEARNYFKESLEFAKAAKNLGVLKNAYLNMAVVSEGLKDYKEALQYRFQYEKLQDSIWNRDRVWELAEQEKQFAIKQKEQEVELLEKTTQLQKTRQNILFLVLAFFLLFGSYLFWAYRQRIKANRIISSQKEALAALNATKNWLFSIFSHDLRSPVHRLKEINTRLKEASMADKSEEFNHLINQNITIANNTYSLLDNMLYWVLEETRQLHFRQEKVHLRAITEQVCHNFIPFLELKQIQLLKDIPPEFFVYIDTNTIKIALRNIIENAVKFTGENGKITISAVALGTEALQLSIADTGKGMDAQTLKQLFNIQQKQRQKDAYGNTGTGLGLHLVKTMTEKNGGTIDVKSQQGKGTEVLMTLKRFL